MPLFGYFFLQNQSGRALKARGRARVLARYNNNTMKEVLRFGVASLSLCLSLKAQVFWDGDAGNDDFLDPTNWVGDALPMNTDPGVFNTSSFGGATTINADINSSFDVAGIHSTATASSEVIVNLGSGVVLDVRTGGGRDFFASTSSLDLVGAGVGVTEIVGDLNGADPVVDLIALSGGAVRVQDLTISGDLGTSLEFEGSGELSANSIVSNIETTVVSGASALIADSVINDNFTVESGAEFSLGSAGVTTLEVNGDATVNGNWVFDVAESGFAAQSDILDVSGGLDLSGSFLEIQGSTLGASSSNPIILAEYDSLTGFFGGVSGLAPGQYIDFNFNGNNQIAIVPEPSRVFPILAGFLPLLVLRRRFRR